MPSCQRCGSSLSGANDLMESLKWRANPVGFFAGAAYGLHSLATGKKEAHLHRCSNCDSYELSCGHCKSMVKISSRKRHQDIWRCPACGGECRVVSV
jgi:hypothetical protein